MATASIVAFWLVAVTLIAVPGADWAFTIGSALRGHTVLPAVGGLVLGYAAMTAVVSAGVGALVAGAPAALTALTLAGGAYLMWQGAATVARPASPGAAAGPPARTKWGTVLRGIGVSGLNPKALLLFLALLPQFTDPAGAWPRTAQIALLGTIFTATCAVFYLALGTFATTALRARPATARAVSRVSGTGMLLIGAALIAEHLLR